MSDEESIIASLIADDTRMTRATTENEKEEGGQNEDGISRKIETHAIFRNFISNRVVGATS